MKYLYLLGSVLRSRFDKEQRKYTLCAMLMFFFSSFLMLFAASTLGSDVLWTKKEEDEVNTTYMFYVEKGIGDDNRAPITEHILDTLFSLESNGIDRINIDIVCNEGSDDKLGVRATDVEPMPVFKSSFDGRLAIRTFYHKLPSRALYQHKQHIIKGREISQQDIEEDKAVIVLPEFCGVGVGETARLSGEEFEVVGITSDSYVRFPSSFLDRSTLKENTGLYCVINDVDFDTPMTDETYEAVSEALYQSTGKEIDRYEQYTLSGDPIMAYTLMMGIFGTIIALFSVFGIYYPTLRLCRETMPMLSVLKLCGMKMLPSLGLLVLSVAACYFVSFGLASVVLTVTESVFSQILNEYELKGMYYGFSAVIFILVAVVAIAPPMIQMAKSRPSEEVES